MDITRNRPTIVETEDQFLPESDTGHRFPTNPGHRPLSSDTKAADFQSGTPGAHQEKEGGETPDCDSRYSNDTPPSRSLQIGKMGGATREGGGGGGSNQPVLRIETTTMRQQQRDSGPYENVPVEGEDGDAKTTAEWGRQNIFSGTESICSPAGRRYCSFTLASLTCSSPFFIST